MLQQWRRSSRRRLLALAAAGAAGAAAAYAVYKWWYAQAEEGEDQDAAGPSGSRVGGGSGVLLDPRGRPGAAQLDAEAHLAHHFDSIQEIADGTTIPSLLPALWRALAAAAEMEGPLEALRAGREGGAPLTTADKVALWQELKLAAFARLAAAAWLLPLLDLFVRVQLNILGRHLYLESAVDSSRRQDPSLQPPMPKLSAPSQEQFLSHAEFLAQEGHAALVAQARAAAERALGGVPLQQAVGGEAVARLLSDTMAALGEAAGRGEGGWAAYLLPSPAAVAARLQVRAPDNRAMLPMAEAMLVDQEVVEGMVAEARRIVDGPQFGEALLACAQEVARTAAADLQQRVGPEPLPLAKVVPLASAVAQDVVVSPTSPCIPALARLEPVRSLAASVYGCC
eukprot:scaffold3.g6264.t1